ncbi:hypothetical protein CLV63_112190 [Murinocardiopsis flavida]|uniref:Uncharacterized protein n=1 Tax=Murinocardiopsis flavida TaxID=645275 RepID=A0A2P8DGI9_9ACTN|nr:hypothetical protein [Murinocardiopsis flavida]PSK96306.1 hypothetical protein CLV63_112190 [Murinocardiopsis flavida]
MDQLPAPRRPGGPWPAADAAFVNSGASGIGCVLAGVGALLFLTACAAAGAIWPESVLTNGGAGGERIIATVIAVFFGAISLLVLLMLPAALRTHGLAVDGHGLWYVMRQGAELVPWAQVRAIGGSYTMSAKGVSTSLGQAAGKAIAEAALTDNGRQHFAVEVFLNDPAFVAGRRRNRLALLHAATEKEPPPAPGLPGARLRIVIRGIGDYRQMAAHLHQTAPHLWIGEYRR